MLLLLSFLCGRMTKLCDECLDHTVTGITRDTFQKDEIVVGKWIPRNEQNTTKALRMPQKYPTYPSTTNNASSGDNHNPELRVINDSVAMDKGVGLSFRHLLMDNDILESDYKIRYPVTTITEIRESKTVVRQKQAISLGAMTLIGNNRALDAAITIGYRYDKLQIWAGYSVRNSIMIGVMREF